jgi:RNase P protein component
VDRNKIKRLIKENYRLEKGILYQKYADTSVYIDMIIIYTETKILSFHILRKRVIELINKIIKDNNVKKSEIFTKNLEKMSN